MKIRWARFFLGVFTAFLIMGIAVAYTHKNQYTDRLANFSRSVIGDENTARVESWYFAVQDRLHE